MNPVEPNDPAARPSFEPGRRFRVGFSVAVAVVSLLALVAMINFWAVTRHVWRFDVRARDGTVLSPLTLQTLAGLTNTVTASVLFNPEDDLFGHVDGLLREYAARSPQVRIEVIDPIRNPGSAQLLKSRYKLGADAGNLVVFDGGGGRSRVVTSGQLSVYNSEDTQALMAGENREIRRSGFTGEYHFTSALAAVQEGDPVRAAYLLGHGEHPPDSQEPLLGYSRFMELLTGEKNLQVELLRLGGATNDIPPECQLLILAGPTSPLLPGELAKIEAFLQRGGRLLALLHPYSMEKGTGLEGLLLRWGIAAPPGYAGDEQFSSYTKLDVISRSFGSHPLVLPLRRDEGAVYFPLPRIVAPVPGEQPPEEAPRAEVLVWTSDAGFTRSRIQDGQAAFDPARDIKGKPVPMAVAAEKGGVSGIAASRGATRLVVIGDSTMFANESLGKPLPTANNRDFANLAISWLLDRPQSLAIGPRPIREYRLQLTEAQVHTLRWVLLGAMPGAVLLVGMGVWFRRRS
ncbi:MAG: GldG family protein [Verrucomicrobia bacterium]|nr:GldG family protein [Verrucomicrobiota bacterium]